jgi:hypothetical protein
VSRTVTTPGGRAWLVRHRWVPRLGGDTLWARLRKRLHQVWQRLDVPDPGCFELFGEGIIAALALAIGVLILVFIVLPLVVAVLDLVIVVILAVGGLVARVVFRRPWIVEARADDGQVHRWPVAGWAASRRCRAEIEEALASGAPLPGGATVSPGEAGGPPEPYPLP